MNYTLHPGASEDLNDACKHYRVRASGRVVVRFLDEFERAAKLLAREPGLGTPTDDDRAAYPLHGFPYTVIFKPTEPGIRILVLRHQHRDPQHGEGRR